jgi:hypothetical protein
MMMVIIGKWHFSNSKVVMISAQSDSSRETIMFTVMWKMECKWLIILAVHRIRIS